MSSGKAEARAKGGNAVVGTERCGFGGDAEGGWEADQMEGSEETERTETETGK